jgi:hypothetical protein
MGEGRDILASIDFPMETEKMRNQPTQLNIVFPVSVATNFNILWPVWVADTTPKSSKSSTSLHKQYNT